MAQELIVSGFGEAWDGRYIPQYNTLNSNCDIWKHETEEYYLFRNPWYWMICLGLYYLADNNLKAQKDYVISSTPTGDYYGVNGSPSGVVSWENFP